MVVFDYFYNQVFKSLKKFTTNSYEFLKYSDKEIRILVLRVMKTKSNIIKVIDLVYRKVKKCLKSHFGIIWKKIIVCKNYNKS